MTKKKEITIKDIHPKNKMTASQLEGFRQCLKAQAADGGLRMCRMETTPLAFSKLKGETDASVIFMGFEWENSHVYGDAFTKAIKRAVMEPLGEYMNFRADAGVEMVSIPASLNYHKEVMETEFFEKGIMKDALIEPGQSCGLHIHTDNDAWTARTMSRFVALMMQSENRSFWTTFGRRVFNQYSPVVEPNFKYKQLKDGSRRVMGMDIKFDKNKNQTHGVAFKGLSSRQIIHFGSSHGTTELRLFRAPSLADQKSDLFSSLEYMDAAIRYCRSATFNKTHIDDFIGFVEDNEKRYPYLYGHSVVQAKLREILDKSLKKAKA